MKTDLDTLFEDWNTAKKKIRKLENNIEKYKRSIDKVLRENKTNKLTTTNYTLEKRKNTKTTLSRANVPSEIWERYSTRCTYDSYHLKARPSS